MQQDKAIEVEGRITNVLPGTMFHVELANKHTVLAHISGKMRKRFIRLLNGDRVKLEMSPYDLSKAGSCTVSASFFLFSAGAVVRPFPGNAVPQVSCEDVFVFRSGLSDVA